MRHNEDTANVLSLLTNAEQREIAKYAAVASYFRGTLPRSLDKDAGLITSQFLAAYVYNTQEAAGDGIEQKLDRILARVEQAILQGGRNMAAIDDLNNAIASIRSKVQEALDRLADNPTPEAVAESTAALNEVGTLIDSIDPTIPGGVITPETEIVQPE